MTHGSYDNYDESTLAGALGFDDRLAPVSDLIQSIDRPGDYCTRGSRYVPMPRIEVDAAGVLAFPLQPAQARALVSIAERAPYGRGEETVVDCEVRDCWQIAPEALIIGGASWDSTFPELLDAVSTGLGCQREALTAELYKMLVYEKGGFFAPHRDTEKADGMVATLVIALPAVGKGGELVVRHHGHETVVEMLSDDPSELTFAAFYADCEHEIRPVLEGHRICLVYNLLLTPGQQAPTEAPDFTSTINPIADAIETHFSEPDGSDKLVWVLEHDYSTAGLSFDALKNVDASVARVLSAAAMRSDCALYLAGLHVEESGDAYYVGNGGGYYDDADDADDYEIDEVHDIVCQLEDFIGTDGSRLEFGALPLEDGELMPPGRLMPDAPDSQRLTEATGNAGATLERCYYRAALVLWPRRNTPKVVARAGFAALAAFLESESNVSVSGKTSLGSVETFASQVVESWPKPPDYELKRWAIASARVLKVLCRIGNRQTAKRFLDHGLHPYYHSELNKALVSALIEFGPNETGSYLLELVDIYASRMPQEIVELAGLLQARANQTSGENWHVCLKEVVKAICSGFEVACKVDLGKTSKVGEWQHRKLPDPWSPETLHTLFDLTRRFDLENEASDVATALCKSPKRATPDRTLPQLVERLAANGPEDAADGDAFSILWDHASAFLLSRSRNRPLPPSDWVISSGGLNGDSEYFREIVQFCADPAEKELRISARKDIRDHVADKVRRNGLDIEFRTERKGSPHTLVCTKTRGTFNRRMKQYGEDVPEMRRLVAVAERVSMPSEDIAELRMAVEAARPG